ncbi:MAG: type II toxin-antitoxin system VapC family toxin [Verrucomicrobiales bacterium]|nr:type II toxin-antitoxin system VapC family toxin [Verrucomicrobiales bacterium]
MATLVDTNILLRSIQPTDPLFGITLSALQILGCLTDRLAVVPQNMVEFWAVATRPRANNGLGLAPSEASVEIQKILSTFQFFPETPTIFDEWMKLVTAYAVSGKDTHDARILAAMKVHGIERILTFDEADFARYKGAITVLTPTSVVASQEVKSGF